MAQYSEWYIDKKTGRRVLLRHKSKAEADRYYNDSHIAKAYERKEYGQSVKRTPQPDMWGFAVPGSRQAFNFAQPNKKRKNWFSL